MGPRRCTALAWAGLECAGLAWVWLAPGVPRALAQQGDRPGETQPDPPAGIAIPEAPALAPAEALASFRMGEPGFVVELAASEPLVRDPVHAAFDGEGRLWVVEMRSYMPDVDGRGELEPVSRVVVLEDVDGDGVFDESRVFLDGLVLPRGVLPCFGGALVMTPPRVIFARDLDGDGKADETRVVLEGIGGLENPEHAANGLLWGLDNWVHMSQHHEEFRFDGERVERRATPAHGQWGLTQDDRGRLYTTPNSDVLRCDLIPKHAAAWNAGARLSAAVNVDVCPDRSVHPVRMNPGINRGYQRDMLRPDLTLAKTTAACSPVIYRSSAWGGDFAGDAFVCEPAGNCVIHVRMSSRDGVPTGERTPGEVEFLASIDERFRPVSLAVAPDGSLLIVDMYRGVIQHRTYVTTFLRRQVEARGLETPIGLGRIWRVRRTDQAPGARPRTGTLPDEELVALLEHPDGWWRDQAQQRMVQERRTGTIAALRRLAGREDASPEARAHALWTLDGMDALGEKEAILATEWGDPVVASAGAALLERWPDSPRAREALVRTALDGPEEARWRALVALGAIPGEWATEAVGGAMVEHAKDPVSIAAGLTGLAGREAQALTIMSALAGSEPGEGGTDGALRAAMSAVADSAMGGSPRTRRETLELVVARPRWVAALVLGRAAAWQRAGTPEARTMELDRAPEGWEHSLRSGLWSLQGEALRVDAGLRWAGRARRAARTLSGADLAMIARGRELYAACAACHGADGHGVVGQAPALAGSPMVLGPNGRLVRIALHGMRGPIERDAGTFDGQMPAAPFARDEDIAAVLSALRRSFGNEGGMIRPEEVARARAVEADRVEPWTEQELAGIND